MFRALTPIFALIIAIGLGFTYIRTEFARISDVQAEEKEYVDAIERASELNQVLAERVAQKNSYNTVDLERLNVMLPDSVNEVSVVLDLDALARRNRLALSDIEVLDSEQGSRDGSDKKTEEDAGSAATISKDISFTALGTYDDFRSFIAQLEKSLVFFDIVSLKFDTKEGDLTSFAVTVRTYAYNPVQ